MERVDEVLEQMEEFRDVVHLVFVSNATSVDAARKKFGPHLHRDNASFCINPSSSLYQSFGAAKGMTNTFTATKFENFLGLIKFPYYMVMNQHVPFVNAGNPFQQGLQALINLESGQNLYLNLESSPGFPVLDWLAVRTVLSQTAAPGIKPKKRKLPSDEVSINYANLIPTLVILVAAIVHYYNKKQAKGAPA